MKISKILAGVSAMAMAAAMAISASAATTITISNPETTDWANCFPKYDPGDGSTTDDCIDAKSFTKDTAMDVTINYEWVDSSADYVQVKPASQGDSWKGLKELGYLTNINVIDQDCTGIADGVGWTTNDGQTLGFAMQEDGFFISNDSSCSKITFTITADGVNAMIAKATESDTAYDGIIFQGKNIKINSIELSQDGVKLSSEMKGVSTDNNTTSTNSTDSKTTTTTDSKSSTNNGGSTSTNNGGSTTTANKTDSTANTGATAGLALAGIALAGAAFVVSKKK